MLKVCHYNEKLTNCNLSSADSLNFFSKLCTCSNVCNGKFKFSGNYENSLNL